MREITMPIDRVTVFEDRAYVRRLLKLEVTQGVSRFKVTQITPLAMDKTLTGEAGAGARVVDVRLERARPQLPATVATKPMPLVPQRRSWRTELELLDSELGSAFDLQKQTLWQLTREVKRGQSDSERWGRELSELEAWTGELLERKLQIENQLAAVETFSPSRPPTPLSGRLQGSVLLEIEATQTGPVELVIEYGVPGACWRPYHSAILKENEESLEFRCEGCVWQNTGEDWDDVELVFSTQRPSLGVDPPSLDSEFLNTQKKAAQLVVAAREQEVDQLAPTGGLPSWTAPELPGIDDRGEPVELSAGGRTHVPANGQPVRTQLFAFTAPTCLERVLTAELHTEVMLKTIQQNISGQPLLAGPVDFIRDAGLAGRGSILYVAPGEEFELGWGPDPTLRTRRSEQVGDEAKANILGGWRQVEHAVVLKLSNLGTAPRQIEVIERIPVSEIKEVEIACQEISPDQHGFVRWQVELGPHGRRELELRYTVKRRKDVKGLEHAGPVAMHA